ncbi:unnamed protein product, partial [marine sediment metagenome]
KNIQSQENLKKLKLIDVSCGSGAFLVESFNILENRYSKIRESENNSVTIGTLDSWNNLTIDKDIEPFSKRMSSLYLQFNNKFNTAIFAPSPVDDLELSDQVYESVINRLYKYNFDKIDADVLGNVYEEYLGHVLKEKEGKYTLTEDYLNKQKHGI